MSAAGPRTPGRDVIRLRGVRRAFGAVEAVAGVDLDVPRGRTMALLGASGCGKTTLLRLIAGFEQPQAGTIEIDGAAVAGSGLHVPPERRRVGMVFQEYALFPHLDVLANVAFGLPRRERRRGRGGRLADLLALVGLEGLEDRYPHELSGGQQQRVALARALAPSPAVILLDEPFSNLDAGLRAQVRADVQRIIREARASAVFVTHDQEEALALADEVAVMSAGRIVQHATPEALYHTPTDRSVAAFVGDADFVTGRARGGMVETDLGPLLLAEEALDGTVDVLVRPEDVHLSPDPHGDGVVVGREFYGHDQMLFVRLSSGRLVRARLGPVSDLAPGERCRVGVVGRLQAYRA